MSPGFAARLPALGHHGVAAERFPAFVNLVFAPHELDVVLVTVVLAGRGVHVIDGVEFEIPGPSFALTRPGESHVLLTDESGIDVVNIYLDLETRTIPRLAPPLDVPLAVLFPWGSSDARVRLPQVALSDVDRMRAILDLLERETEAAHDSAGDAMDALLRLLLIECARAMAENGHLPDARRASHPAVERVRSHLDRSYLEHHSLDELAALAHLERTYLSRLFAEATGETITGYLARRRIAYAMSQLQSSDAGVARIAAASGFRDLSHFTRTFRRHVGVSPREYRREHEG